MHFIFIYSFFPYFIVCIYQYPPNPLFPILSFITSLKMVYVWTPIIIFLLFVSTIQSLCIYFLLKSLWLVLFTFCTFTYFNNTSFGRRLSVISHPTYFNFCSLLYVHLIASQLIFSKHCYTLWQDCASSPFCFSFSSLFDQVISPLPEPCSIHFPFLISLSSLFLLVFTPPDHSASPWPFLSAIPSLHKSALARTPHAPPLICSPILMRPSV